MNLRSATATVVLGSLALVLVAAVGWLLLLGPLTSKIGETRTSVSDAEARNLTLASQLAVLQQQAEDLSGTRTVAEDLDRLFPPTADQPGLFTALVRAARRSGYAPQDITTLSPTAPVPVVDGAPVDPAAPPAPGVDVTTADLAVQVVTLSVEGDYDQARRLLDRLEQLDRAFLVRSVSVTGSSEDAGFTLAITAATFLAPPLVAPDEAATG
ncbi:hypothetical protein NPS01_00270 [Nocardioides psychrotolerans]|uniref:Tfp pilus assembly protein PilO n=1 Tax=Nocardioides psychrotolerans TaxID=1005945 RepID=A0A1I3C110_9ACTN|nr:hypothetical protein [Nocardioides psychrotolerans]GEP36364.1 hypothetical protein NPS01_00270 [Nocardioides psychrotolerans]SFH67671.1 Tfp pilus assembly protein PilO [Nocardioides psychrotolerans]